MGSSATQTIDEDDSHRVSTTVHSDQEGCSAADESNQVDALRFPEGRQQETTGWRAVSWWVGGANASLLQSGLEQPQFEVGQ